MYVIVTNYVNWHGKNLRSDMGNTGNLKIQFEWLSFKGIDKIIHWISFATTYSNTITRSNYILGENPAIYTILP